jgi:hypothetical protein
MFDVLDDSKSNARVLITLTTAIDLITATEQPEYQPKKTVSVKGERRLDGLWVVVG